MYVPLNYSNIRTHTMILYPYLYLIISILSHSCKGGLTIATSLVHCHCFKTQTFILYVYVPPEVITIIYNLQRLV